VLKHLLQVIRTRLLKGGFEYNLVLVAAAFALAAVGAGSWSLDHALALNVAGSQVVGRRGGVAGAPPLFVLGSPHGAWVEQLPSA